MTHFAVLVLCPNGTTEPESTVARLLAPYDEDGEWGREGSRWDWWMIGGRQSGMLDATYDPEADPRNIETCWLCGGTGDRATWRNEPKASQHPSGCNGCLGKGRSARWPTQWAPFRGDVVPATHIDMDRLRYLPTAVVTPDGAWHERIENGYGMFAMPRGDELSDEQRRRRRTRRRHRAAADLRLAELKDASSCATCGSLEPDRLEGERCSDCHDFPRCVGCDRWVGDGSGWLPGHVVVESEGEPVRLCLDCWEGIS